MVDNTSTNFPIDRMRAVDQETGQFSKEARTLLRALWNRTGGGTGTDVATVKLTADAALAGANASLKKAANLSDLVSVPVARSNLGLGSVALGNTVPGWTNPTGSGSRAAINADFTQTAAVAYSQSDLQLVIDQLVAVQKALAQLILDAESAKVISN